MKYILLPGLDGTGLLFKPFSDIVSDDFDYTIIDYPINKLLNYDDLVEHVIPKLPEQDFIIIAKSFSGIIAYKIGLQKPPHLKNIIFVASFLENPKPKFLKLSRFLPRQLILKLPIPKFFIRRYLLGKYTNKSIIQLFKFAVSQVSTNIIDFRLKLISTLEKPQHLCDIPAVYIQASNDKLVSQAAVESFHSVFENVRVFTINGPHFLLQALPKECAECILPNI